MFEDQRDDDLITTPELAKWFRLSVRTVENYRMLYPHLLPPQAPLPGRAVRYRVGDVRAFLLRR